MRSSCNYTSSPGTVFTKESKALAQQIRIVLANGITFAKDSFRRNNNQHGSGRPTKALKRNQTMANRKKRTRKKSTRRNKKSSSVFGALILEIVAVLLFMFLFTQARAERQAAVTPSLDAPVVQGMFEQTPLQNIFGN
ncbi:MAG: hypothetical protein AB8B55_17960 [Mariniblastus sp.]